MLRLQLPHEPHQLHLRLPCLKARRHLRELLIEVVKDDVVLLCAVLELSIHHFKFSVLANEGGFSVLPLPLSLAFRSFLIPERELRFTASSFSPLTSDGLDLELGLSRLAGSFG